MDVTFDDFAKLDIRIGRVIEAKELEGSEKLIRCVVDFGELGERVIFSGIKKWYKPEDLVGKLLPYILNLPPKKMMGEESQGMLVACEVFEGVDRKAVLLLPDQNVSPGTRVL